MHLSMKNYDFYHGLLNKYNLGDVFTPSTSAGLTYINRDKLEESLDRSLRMPGKQIILYGPSGSGKTTLLRKLLKDTNANYKTIHCSTGLKYQDLIKQAFDAIDSYYLTTQKYSSTFGMSNSLGSGVFQTDISTTDDKQYVRVLPPQLSIGNLAQLYGKGKCILIIDDLHKMKIDEKKNIVDVMKLFVDEAHKYPELKIICIGDDGLAGELIHIESNLTSSVSQIKVPLLHNSELKSMISLGCELLNIEMSQELISNIVYMSNNVASVAHQLCYNICRADKIKFTRFKRKKIKDDVVLCAVNDFVNTNLQEFVKIYKDVTRDSLGWYILKTFIVSKKGKLNLEEIKTGVCMGGRTYSINLIIDKLNELSQKPYDIIHYDSNSSHYNISNPFWGVFLKMQLGNKKGNKITNGNLTKSN